MDTRCLAALCIGIEEYQDAGHFVNLPNASRDAQDFSREMLIWGFQERNLISLVGHVTEGALTRSISSFLELVENNVSQRDIHLVVVYVAAHGEQLQSGELPAIWASDSDAICDLDALLVKPLDMMKGGKIKVWFVIDTCRENRSINTWTGLAEGNAYRRLLWRSQTDFQLLLACDRGRAASDQHSMTKELISALRDPHNDLEAVCKKAQASVQEQSRGRQRPWISSRGDFSGIFPPAAAGFGAGAAAAAAAAAADAVADAAAALDSLDRVCDRTLGILASLGQGAGLPSWVRVRDRTLCCHAVGDAGN